MGLFRTELDIEYVKRINQELIENVISEKVTYYPISAQYSKTNIYGESREKVFDPPIEIYALIEWLDQDISTVKFGQDIVYNLRVGILNKHLQDVNVKPYEGDMVEYSGRKFEITSINVPSQIFGKAFEDIGVIMDCTTIRKSSFDVSISGTVENQNATNPDTPLTASLSAYSYGDARYALSSSL